MKNEQGITLIELLGVLVIMGILITMTGSILTSSLKTSKRATTDQRLQQEANYITEVIRKEYLKSEKEKAEETEIKKIVVKIDNENKQLLLYDDVISEGFTYSFDEARTETMKELIRAKEHQSFKLLLSKDNHTYTVDTTFSKLR